MQGEWRKHKFQINENDYSAIFDLAAGYEAGIDIKEGRGGRDQVRVLKNQNTVVQITTFFLTDALKKYYKFVSSLGFRGTLYIGNTPITENEFVLTAVNFNSHGVEASGAIQRGDVQLSFLESPPKPETVKKKSFDSAAYAELGINPPGEAEKKSWVEGLRND